MEQDELQRLLTAIPRERTYLLPALHLAHDALGYLPPWALKAVSAHFGIPGVEVESVAHSYSELRLEPPPAVHIHVCAGLICWLRGSSNLLESLGQTTSTDEHNGADIEEMACAFMCGVAPVAKVNGTYLGNADASTIARLIATAAKEHGDNGGLSSASH